MTTLNVTLSGTLATKLEKPGVSAYAVYFTPVGTPVWSNLVTDGTVQSSGTVPIALPGTFVGGKVYFLVQSQIPSQPYNLETLITTQSEINWNTGSLYDFGYDSFEVTLQGSAADAGNLTAVNGFGLPMEVSVPYSNGTTATVGFGISGSSVVTDIQNINTATTAIYDYTSGPLTGDFRTALSPSEAVSLGASLTNPTFKVADWSGYVQSLEGPQAQDIVLSGEFNGAPDVNGFWHNGGYFAYQLQWDPTFSSGGTVTPTFWLVPLASSQIKGDIQITPANLENSIYSTLGDANVYGNQADPTPYSGLGLSEPMITGANNQWGKVLGDFLTGFTGGFYEESGKSPNPQITGTIDLNRNLNWDPIYAFGDNLASTPPATYQSSDPYSQIFYQNSNSYGSGYSDALMSQYATGGPLISVSEPGSSTNVPNINLTIFANGETPGPGTSHGYTPPQIYNYISATAPNYYAVPTDATTGDNIVLDFASSVANNAGVVLAATDTITLDILTSDAGGVPAWDTITFDGSSPAAGTLGLWQNWNITGSSGTYEAAPFVPAVTVEPAGSMLINNLPVASSGVSWYEIGVGTGTISKTFDLYTTTSGGEFENPNYANQLGALAIDGLAIVIPQASTAQTIPTFTVNFAPSSAVTFDPSLLVPNTGNVSKASFSNTPDAPVAGIFSGGTFIALPGQALAATNTITTSFVDVGFAWTGDNPNALSGATPWVSSFTNKIDAGDVALVTIASASGHQTTTGTADIDGQWNTGTVILADGTYTVTMQEFLPSDTAFANPLTPISNALTVIETPCFAAGTRIRTNDGEVPVELLSVGAVLPTAGGRGDATVIWLGHRTVDCRRHPRARDVTPIRIGRDAFGTGRPEADVVLSPDHAVFVDDVLIPVRFLVNDSTVRHEPAGVVTYHHVELDRHDIILAAGLPVESFLDTGNRSAFANGGPVVQMHPDFCLRTWEAEGCAPLVVNGPELERVRARLRVQADALAPVAVDRVAAG